MQALLKKTEQELQEELAKHHYIASEELVLAIKNAAILEKPLLIEGPPGVGKTELAKAIAKVMETEMIRLQCTPEMSERKALYEFNHAKQLLFMQFARQSQEGETKTWAEQLQAFDREGTLYSDSFLIKRPILRSFVPEDNKTKVLLVDELEKTSQEFEYSLLEAFSEFAISIPELGTIQATKKPFVIITSNRERKLTGTMLRRCSYVFLGYPDVERTIEIIRKKTEASPQLAKAVAQMVEKIRNHPNKVKHTPSVAESIDWAQVLSHHCQEIETVNEMMGKTLSVISKNEYDQTIIKEILAS